MTIHELALLVAKTIGFTGGILTDPSKPDGTPRKLMDVSRLHNMGWKHRIALRDGIAAVYAEFAKSELANA